MIFGSDLAHTVGYFKTKDACVDALSHVIFVTREGVKEIKAEGICVPVETPLNRAS
jgi:hypothetical protein